MRIVQIAAIEESVPPHKYGGTELVVSNITEGMVARGHEVFLLASGDSKTNGRLKPLIPKSLRNTYEGDELELWRNYYRFSALADILDVIRKIKPDVVHNHLTWRMVMFERFIRAPMFTTVHGPLTALFERTAYTRFSQSNFVSISDNQRKAMPNMNWVRTIYNGIDVEAFEFSDKSGDYFVFLGRISPEKGIGEICKMIRKTSHKLKIAAKVDPVDRKYFETEVKPYIDGEQIEFLGEVDHPVKVKLLKGAKAILHFLSWEEPFSLAIIESMACGTPVISNPRGSMREQIVDNKTGFFVQSIAEMQEKLDQVDKLKRIDSRNHVAENFSKERMVEEYLSLAYDLHRT
ncbi:MAG: glycosyltransferase family 4 protein [bacterium]|nr:glycosyltransferase family 4 protein [bacterium]